MIRRFIHAIWQSIIRVFAFISKEMRLILHQPRLIFSLILGPFLILLLFGIGYQEAPRTLRTLFVVPENSQIEEYVRSYAENLSPTIEFAGITADADEADRQLRNGEVDLVVVTPADPSANWQNDEPAKLSLFHFEIDALESQYIQVLGQRYAEVINRQLLEQEVRDSQSKAATWHEDLQLAQSHTAALRSAIAGGDKIGAKTHPQNLKQDLDLLTLGIGSGLALVGSLENATNTSNTVTPLLDKLTAIQTSVDEDIINQDNITEESEATVDKIDTLLDEVDSLLSTFEGMDPAVMVAPFQSETLSITNVQLLPMHFYVPGVIALLLQHLAITLAGLSIVREKLGGVMELIRAAPTSAFEMLLGKYAGYSILISFLVLVLTGLIVWVLGVPQLGSWAAYALVILVLLLASLGMGFHISLSARTDSQAIQFAMLTLLASIFFSGFFMPLYRIAFPVRLVSWLLPATYGTKLLQEVMLRGQSPDWLLLSILSLGAAILLLLALVRLRRQLRGI
ncbi:MAG: ABC transporter permease [Candidatus Promineifilaceae bacterium]